MSARRGVPERLRVFDLKFLEMVALFQGLGEGAKRNKGSILPPDGHIVTHGVKVLCLVLVISDNA
jgi:hypothetical protein